MPREITTAYSLTDVDDLERQGFRLSDPRVRSEMRLVRFGAEGGAEYPPGAHMQRRIKE